MSQILLRFTFAKNYIFSREKLVAFDGYKNEKNVELNNNNIKTRSLRDIVDSNESAQLDDSYDGSESFEELLVNMKNVLPNGKIMKRVLLEGDGEVVPNLSQVQINYKAFLENKPIPIDSTYLCRRPFSFKLNTQETFLGLNLAVSTMKMKEKSQFIIHPDLGYGKFECPCKIPEKSHVLFEIELKRFTKPNTNESQIVKEVQNAKDFETIHKFVVGLWFKGNEYFEKRNYKMALREYNNAIDKIQFSELKTDKEFKDQQKLLFKLLINTAVTYSILNDPKRCCFFCNKIFRFTRNTELKIPCKIYFHNGRALLQLSDYNLAEKRLLKALELEPANNQIADELKLLSKKRKEDLERDEEFRVSCAFREKTATRAKEEENREPTGDFKEAIEEMCLDLIEDKQGEKYNLPPKLTKKEYEFIKCAVKKYNLIFTKTEFDSFISKK